MHNGIRSSWIATKPSTQNENSKMAEIHAKLIFEMPDPIGLDIVDHES